MAEGRGCAAGLPAMLLVLLFSVLLLCGSAAGWPSAGKKNTGVKGSRWR